jgi:hypothetical protein
MFYVTTLAALLALKAYQAHQLQKQQDAWAESPEGQAKIAAEAAFEAACMAAMEAEFEAEKARWAAFERLTFPY